MEISVTDSFLTWSRSFFFPLLLYSTSGPLGWQWSRHISTSSNSLSPSSKCNSMCCILFPPARNSTRWASSSFIPLLGFSTGIYLVWLVDVFQKELSQKKLIQFCTCQLSFQRKYIRVRLSTQLVILIFELQRIQAHPHLRKKIPFTTKLLVVLGSSDHPHPPFSYLLRRRLLEETSGLPS